MSCGWAIYHQRLWACPGVIFDDHGYTSCLDGSVERLDNCDVAQNWSVVVSAKAVVLRFAQWRAPAVLLTIQCG
jgi:hypothetical protein